MTDPDETTAANASCLDYGDLLEYIATAND
jgi:hypothetical protein